MTAAFLGIALFCGLVNFASSILILRELRSTGVDVGFYEMRWQVHKHLKRYREITVNRSGRPALPFYVYWVSLGGMVMFGGLMLLSIAR